MLNSIGLCVVGLHAAEYETYTFNSSPRRSNKRSCLCLDMLLPLDPRQLWNNTALCVFWDGLGSLAFIGHYSHFGSRRGRTKNPGLEKSHVSVPVTDIIILFAICQLARAASSPASQPVSQTGIASCVKTKLSKWEIEWILIFLS